MKKLAVCLGLGAILLGAPALAHEAHVHGLAHLNLSVEEGTVEIELKSALANFISFEHAPETEAQKKEVRDMAAVLNDAGRLFTFPAEAGCRLERVSFESPVLDDELLSAGAASKHGGEAKKEATRHDDHEHKDHDHDDHEHGDHEHGDHDHDDDHEGHAHGNIDADLTFVCAAPARLDRVEVGLFEVFPALHEVEVQMMTPKGQGAAKLTEKDKVIKW